MYNILFLQIKDTLQQDVIYFDPPWGGRVFKNNELLSLGINNINIICIINNLLVSAKLIVMRVPYNYNFNEFFQNINGKINIKKLDKSQILLCITNN